MKGFSVFVAVLALTAFSVSCDGGSGDNGDKVRTHAGANAAASVATARTEGGNTMQDNTIRHAMLAGSWYEGDPGRLRAAVRAYIDSAAVERRLGEVIGLIAPHAGHVYSGTVAGAAYRQVLDASYDAVIVIAPNHTDPRIDFISVMTSGAYETPLGRVDIDTDIADAIVDHQRDDNIEASELGHTTSYNGRYEHSVEIQLPFLQVALGGVRFVPVIMGAHDIESCRALAGAIVSAVKGRKVLIVASTDLSHFHDAKTAERLDGRVANFVREYLPENLLVAIGEKRCEACGAAPIAAVMIAARDLGATNSFVLERGNSGDVTGDAGNVVGYMAAAMTTPPRYYTLDKAAGEAEDADDLGITDDERTVLRNIVQNTLTTVVNGGSVPNYNNYNGNLGKPLGAFVTLHKKGDLRGCIGTMIGTEPLINTVAEMTAAAALKDTRFRPVTPAELPDITFEISVLTPLREIDDPGEIVLGRHGVVLTRGFNRAVFLPQVAIEQGWDLDTFLSHLSQKAGLAADAWKGGDVTFEVFSAEVF